MCRAQFHEKCWGKPRNFFETNPSDWGNLATCKKCNNVLDELLTRPFVAEILKPEFRACDHHHQVRTAVRGEEGNLILNVSRCGPEITEILLNDALRRCRNNTDPNHRHGPGDDRVIPRNDKNMVIPQSIFFEANKIFSDTFDGRGPHTFIEQANGLCQHLLLQTSLEKGNGWCKCQLNNDASPPGKCCFLHYIFAGKAAAPSVINLSRLWLTVAEATKRTGKRPSQLDELKITPTRAHTTSAFSLLSPSPCSEARATPVS